MFIFSRLANLFRNRRARIFIGLAVLLLVVYYIGPLLHLEGQQRMNVVYLVGALAVLWLVVGWIRDYIANRRMPSAMREQGKAAASKAGPDAEQDHGVLDKEFQRAFDELQRIRPGTNVFKAGSSDRLPWVVIIGPPGAGKSTALQASGLRFTSLGRRVRGIGGTKNCVWWLAEEAIFLDTAGRYSTQEEDHEEWLGFLKLLRKYRKERPIDAVLLQVGVNELAHLPPAEVEELALQLRERLDELILNLGIRFPVYLVFSKLDRLEGFQDFFGGLLKAEASQPWGFALDVSTLGGASLADQFDEEFDELMGALVARSTARTFELNTLAQRESVLTFPYELERLRETLRLFTETLFEASRHRERPWLTAVHFLSATQEGTHVVHGHHQGVLTNWGLPAPPLANQRTEASYFVAGMFQRVVKQAKAAARPSDQALRNMKLARLVTILGLSPILFGGSWYLGSSFQMDALWLKDVTARVQSMMGGRGLGGAPDKTERYPLVEELSKQAQVQYLLDVREAEGLIERPHQKAATILRERIDDELLLPIQSALDKKLEEGSEWRIGSDERLFADGFLALKADYVLQQKVCQGADPVNTRTWMGQYLTGVWRGALGEKQADILAGSAPTDMQERITWFFKGNQKSRVQLDPRLRDETYNALKGQSLEGQVSPEVVFNLIVANTDLTVMEPQVDGDFLSEPGLKRVFTLQGCDKFLNSSNQGKEWWRCLLDITNPPTIDRDKTYLDKFKEARYAWLSSIGFKKPITDIASAASGFAAIEQPQASELDQILDALAGTARSTKVKRKRASTYIPETGGWFGWLRGCMRRTERYVEQTEIITMPQVCRQAQEMFSTFGDALKEEDKGPIASSYKMYKDSTRQLRDRLMRVHKSANRNPEALTLVLETMKSEGPLYEVSKNREEFITQLLNGAPRVDPTALGELLAKLELETWTQLIKLASKALQEDWTIKVFQEWSDIKYKGSRDSDKELSACDRIKTFVRNTLEPYSREKLALFYRGQNLRDCQLMEFLGEKMPLSPAVCGEVENALRVARTLECQAGATGSGPTLGLPDAIEATGTECPNPIEWVEIDAVEKVYRCNISSGRCIAREDRKTSGEGRVVVKRKDAGDRGMILYKARDFGSLMSQGNKRGARVEFPVRSDNCKNMAAIVYLVGGSEGSGGSKGDTRYKGISLPAKIIFQPQQ